jgi:hypothetical protein
MRIRQSPQFRLSYVKLGYFRLDAQSGMCNNVFTVTPHEFKMLKIE